MIKCSLLYNDKQITTSYIELSLLGSEDVLSIKKKLFEVMSNREIQEVLKSEVKKGNNIMTTDELLSCLSIKIEGKES